MSYSFSKNKNDENLFRSFVPTYLHSFLPSKTKTTEIYFVPSFLRSFLPSFGPSFLPSKTKTTEIYSFLRSFLGSFLPWFVRSFLPSFQNKNRSFVPSFLPSFLPYFLPSFLFLSCSFCYFVCSFVSIRQTLSHLKKKHLWQVSIQQISRDATKKLQTDMCALRRPRSAWTSVQSDQSSLSMVLSY